MTNACPWLLAASQEALWGRPGPVEGLGHRLMWSVLADAQNYHSGGGALGGAIIAMIMVWAFWPQGKDK